jgi:O-antigen ligase
LFFLFKPNFARDARGTAILVFALCMPLVLLSLQKFQSVLAPFVAMLGRDLTFTGRTDIWRAVLDQPINPLIGAGYLGFWDGPGGQAVFDAVELRGSHNGFLEVYLDGGLVGIVLIYILFISRGLAIARTVGSDRWATLRFAFLIGAIIYNLTEGLFGRLSLVWFTVLLVLVENPYAEAHATSDTVGTADVP